MLYLLEERGCQPIAAQEKRIMARDFATFQQFSRQGAGGNVFSRCPEVPRCEAACVLCQQKDFIEHRYKLNLFAPSPGVVAEDKHGPQ